MRREKIFYVIMILFYMIFPFLLFLDVYEKKVLKDGVKAVVKYNLINIKDVSIYPFVMSILFIVISLVFAVFLIIDLYKNTFYRVHIKILSGMSLLAFSGLIYYFSLFIGSMFFMIICCNLFMLSFDIKLNKKKKLNLLIYIPTYILFLIMLIISFGFASA